MGARFFTLVRTVPGVHPVFSTTGNGLFPGVKRPGRGVERPPFLSSTEVKERVELAIPLTPRLGLYSLLEGELYRCLYNMTPEFNC